MHHAQVFYPPGEEARARRFYGEALGLKELGLARDAGEREFFPVH